MKYTADIFGFIFKCIEAYNLVVAFSPVAPVVEGDKVNYLSVLFSGQKIIHGSQMDNIWKTIFINHGTKVHPVTIKKSEYTMTQLTQSIFNI